MADCTQTLQKASYRMIKGWWEEPVSSIQPSIVNTLVSFAITCTDPSDHGKKKKEEERKKQGRACESGPPPWLPVMLTSSDQWSLSHSSNFKFAQLISAAWHWWTFDLARCLSLTLNTTMTASKRVTNRNTAHAHTHTVSRSRSLNAIHQYNYIIVLTLEDHGCRQLA